MATREQVAELEAAVRARWSIPTAAFESQDIFLLMREKADLRLARARAACIGEQEMPGGESGT